MPGDGGSGLAARSQALRAGRTAQIERAVGEQARGADRGECHADRADRVARLGQADHVHGYGVGVGPERLAAKASAPGVVLCQAERKARVA